MAKRTIRKWLLITIGLVAVGLGVLGIFLPLMPTTVFLLIAAACFARSSERLYNWLLSHRLFGPYIKNWREHRAIARRTKILILVVLWGTLVLSAWLVNVMWIRLILALVGIGVTVFILTVKTMRAEMVAEAGEVVQRERSSL